MTSPRLLALATLANLSKGPPMTSSETAESLAHDVYAAAKRLTAWLKANPGNHQHIYFVIQDAESELFDARGHIRKQRYEAMGAAEKAFVATEPSKG